MTTKFTVGMRPSGRLRSVTYGKIMKDEREFENQCNFVIFVLICLNEQINVSIFDFPDKNIKESKIKES